MELISDNFRIITSLKCAFRYRRKSACFDFDHTLVKPLNNRTFPKDVSDWQWLRPNVPNILRLYYKKGFAIVIFTNQTKLFKLKQIRTALDTLELPYIAYVGVKDIYRKPHPFIFKEYMKANFNFNQSFYVGDALGRKGDWSNSDAEFAKNINMRIYSPEEMFPFVKNNIDINISVPTFQEIILMVGYPGSGKTTFVNKYFKDNLQYAILYGDELKTEAKIKKNLVQEIKNKKSIIIDATHSSVKKRTIFINIAVEYKIPIRVIEITTTFDEAWYNNQKREHPVPKIALYVYRKHYVKPTINEGLYEVLYI